MMILIISFLGEVLRAWIPLPIPGSVWGLILMLTALQTKILKVEQVREASAFFIEIMPVMFIPAGVGLLNAWGILSPSWIPITVITLVTTILVMAVTGQVTQYIIRKEKGKKERDE